jgi:hypothetical protein
MGNQGRLLAMCVTWIDKSSKNQRNNKPDEHWVWVSGNRQSLQID